MRIAVFVDSSLTHGGGFNQGMNAVLQIHAICKGTHEILVFTSRKENLETLSGLGIDAHFLRQGLVDKWINLAATSGLLQQLQRRLSAVGRLEKQLLRHDVDLVYFVDPGRLPLSLTRLNYVATVWDICHADFPEFPEVRARGEFLAREAWLQSSLPQAVAVICDSTTLASGLAARFRLDPSRLVAMPFSPSPFLESGIAEDAGAVLDRHGLERSYYYYPAQLWPHKNHAGILHALAENRSKGLERHVVFSGKDYGNQKHLEYLARRLGVSDLVHFLGFVPAADIRPLYQNAMAVIMPTYFGPTNIPPLEAWTLGVPLVYSFHLAEQAGDAALLVDPDRPESIAGALLQLEDASLRESLIRKGFERLTLVSAERVRAEGAFRQRLDAFAARLGTWKAS